VNANKMLNAPIQGANLTANSKNYAWHRPPQFPDFDQAFRFFVDKFIGNPKRLQKGMTLVMAGIPATTAVSTALISMVRQGQISPDMSLLLAGPAYKVFSRMLDISNVEYLSGFENPQETLEFYAKLQGQESPSLQKAPLPKKVEEKAEELSEALPDVPKGGLMGAPSDEDVVEMDLDSGSTNLIEEQEEK